MGYKTEITQSYDESKKIVWEISAKEPDGWLKAWEVTENGEHRAFFRYFDDAKSYVDSKVNRTLLRG